MWPPGSPIVFWQVNLLIVLARRRCIGLAYILALLKARSPNIWNASTHQGPESSLQGWRSQLGPKADRRSITIWLSSSFQLYAVEDLSASWSRCLCITVSIHMCIFMCVEHMRMHGTVLDYTFSFSLHQSPCGSCFLPFFIIFLLLCVTNP